MLYQFENIRQAHILPQRRYGYELSETMFLIPVASVTLLVFLNGGQTCCCGHMWLQHAYWVAALLLNVGVVIYLAILLNLSS
jgi:hypothetical protein